MKKIFVLVIAIFMVLFFVQSHTYEVSSYVEEDGYAFPSYDFNSILTDQKVLSKNQKVGMVSLSYDDIVYSQLGKFYVGDKKEKINLDYPLIVRENKVMRFMNSGAYFISNDFEFESAYEGVYLSDGTTFNTDGTQIDEDRFILVQLKDGLMMNHQNMVVETTLESYEIPMNSMISFNEDFINYYAYDEGSYVFQAIRGLQNAIIRIDGMSMKYTDFLKKLKIVKEDIEKDKEKQEKIEQEIKEEEKEKETTPQTRPTEEKEKPENNASSNEIIEEQELEQGETNGEKPERPERPERPEKPSEPNNPNEIKPGVPEDTEQSENSNDSNSSQDSEDENDSQGQNEEDGQSDESEDDSDTDESEKPSEPQDPQDPSNPSKPQAPSEEGKPGEEGEDAPIPGYQKPEVKAEIKDVWTYGIVLDVDINDPNGAISRNIKFTFYDENGKTVLRKQIKDSGTTLVTTLPPSKKLYVEGSFQYYESKEDGGGKLEETFLERTSFETLAIEGNVSPLAFNYKNSDTYYAESMELKDVSLKNTSDYDPEDTSIENLYKNTLPYIAKALIHFEDENKNQIETSIKSDVLKKLLNGETINFNTTSVLESYKNYEYDIKFMDRFGNELPTIDKYQGKVVTAKDKPKVTFKIQENKSASFITDITIQDNDKAIISSKGIKVQVLDAQGNPLSLEGKVLNNKNIEFTSETELFISDPENTIQFTNLPFSQPLTLVAKADYDCKDHKDASLNQKTNEEIGRLSFYSASMIPGSLTYKNSFMDIAGTYATIQTELGNKSTYDLALMMSDFRMNLSAKNQDEIVYSFNKEQFNQVEIDKNYDEENQRLIIQEENKETKQPAVYLVAPKTALETQGVWQTFLNGAGYGTTPTDKEDAIIGGKLLVKIAEGTLEPSTKYNIDFDSISNLGGVEYDLQDSLDKTNFTTKKREPHVQYSDFFIGGQFVEFYDLYIDDPHQTIINGDYSVQLETDDGIILDNIECKANETISMIRFDGLVSNKKYTLKFIASKYNDGTSLATQVNQYVFKTYEFEAIQSIQGDLTLKSLSNYYGDDKNGSIYNEPNLLTLTDEIEDGVLLYGNNEKEDSRYFTTGFIKLDTSIPYIISGFDAKKISVHFYKENKVYLGAYNIDNAYLKGSTVLFSKEWWSYYVDAAYIRISASLEAKDNIKIYPAEFSENIFDPEKVENGISFNATYLTYDKNINSSMSDFIEVDEGNVVAFEKSRDRWVALFNKSKEMIGAIQTKSCLEIPDKVEYIRVLYGSDLVNKEENDGEYYFVEGLTNATHKKQVEILATMKDDNNLLSTSDEFKIEFFKATNKEKGDFKEKGIKVYSVEMDGDKTKDIKDTLKYQFSNDAYYRIELSIQYKGRKIVLDTLEFDTYVNTYFINEEDDWNYLTYYPTANFKVTYDVEMKYQVSTNFQGSLDFQGHSLTYKKDTNKDFMYYVRPGAEVKNVVIKGALKDAYVIRTNYGVINNVIYEPYLEGNGEIQTSRPLIADNGYSGTIENFIVKIDGPLQVPEDYYSILNGKNNGTICNGYVYQSNPDARIYTSLRGSVITSEQREGALIENVYTLTDIYSDYSMDKNEVGKANNTSALIAGTSSNGTVRNSFSVGDRMAYSRNNGHISIQGYHTYNDPMFGSLMNVDAHIKNKVSLFSNFSNYERILPTMQDKAVLKDSQWYEKNFNKNHNYLISESVNYGFYPRLNMDVSMMQHQEYISLPKTNVVRPTLTDVTVLNENITKNTAEVMLQFDNPSKVRIKSITLKDAATEILSQYDDDGVYRIKLKINNPTKYISNYEIDEIIYINGSMELVADQEIDSIPVSFYKEVASLNDFAQIKSANEQNYHIVSDFDFEGVNMSTYRINDFKGKMDAGNYNDAGELVGLHTLSNITINSTNYNSFISSLFGTLENINFENVTINSENKIYTGLIDDLKSKAVLNNVHVNKANYTFIRRMGGLTSNAQLGSIIENCSVNDLNAEYKSTSEPDESYGGGLVGVNYGAYIRNSYVAGLHMQASSKESSVGFGGIVGWTSAPGRIEDCYAQGEIKGSVTLGGIVGVNTTTVTRCYSNVILNGRDNMGGISGSQVNATSTLSLGDFISTQSNTENINRINSKMLKRNGTNYGYVGQQLSGKNMENVDVEELLTEEDLTNVDTYLYKVKLGNAFDYTSVEKFGALPKLKSTNGNVLPYQKDLYVKDTNLTVDVENAVQDPEKDEYSATLVINHPNSKNPEIKIDGMEIINQKNTTNLADRTIIDIVAKKMKAIDSYVTTVTVTSNLNENRKKTVNTNITFGGEPVYWRIHSKETWNEIMKDHYNTNENFLITNDIDFASYEHKYLNITANRVDGLNKDGNLPTLKNITFTDSQGTSVFSKINSSFTNLKFENVDIDMNSKKSYVGIVGNFTGKDLRSLRFEDVSIKLTEAGSYLGMIARASSNAEDILLHNINIECNNGGRYVGSFVGEYYGSVKNLEAFNISVRAPMSTEVGGIMGYHNTTAISDYDTNQNIFIRKIEVVGNSSVGGFTGSGWGSESDSSCYYNMALRNLNVIGYGKYVGGVSGQKGRIRNDKFNEQFQNTNGVYKSRLDNNYQFDEYLLKGSNDEPITIEAKYDDSSDTELTQVAYTGGVIGIYGSGVDLKVSNISVKGIDAVGGASGKDIALTNCHLDNIQVSGKMAVGGVMGAGYGSNLTTIYKSKVQAEEGAGGFYGYYRTLEGSSTAWGNYGLGVIECEVNAEKNAGGLVGNIFNVRTDNTYILYDNYVRGSTIKAYKNAGGVFGNVDSFGPQILNIIVDDTTIEATHSHAGNIAGHVNFSTVNTRFSSSYFTNTTVTAPEYAGIAFGEVVYDASNTHILSSCIFKTEVENGNVKQEMMGTGYNQYENKKYMFVIDGSTYNNQIIQSIDDNTEIVKESELTKYKFWKPLVYHGTNNPYGWINLETKPTAGIENTQVLFAPTNDTKLHTYNIYAENDNGEPLTGIHKVIFNDSTTVSEKQWEDPKTYVEVEFKNGVGLFKHNTPHESSSCNNYHLYRVHVLINEKDKIYRTSNRTYTAPHKNKLVLNDANTGKVFDKFYLTPGDTTPTLQVVGGGAPYTWYRVSALTTEQGYRNADVLKNITGDTLRINSPGTYYAVDSDGNVSPFIVVDHKHYYPFRANMPYFETYEKGKNPFTESVQYAYNDALFDGGVLIKEEAKTYQGVMLSSGVQLLSDDELTLPEMRYYASGINQINLEFDDSLGMDSSKTIGDIKISINGKEYVYPLNQRVYTFYYDFVSDIKVEVTNTLESKEYVITPYDVRQTISVFGNEYYAMYDGGIKSSKQDIQDDIVHIYENLALTSDGSIYDIDLGEVIGTAKAFEKANVKALHQFVLDGYNIDAYHQFSVVSGNNTVMQELRFVVKNNSLIAVDPKLSSNNYDMLVDMYNEQEFVTFLDENGSLVNMKDPIQLPDKFRNTRIVEMSNTYDSDSTMVLIRYSNGEAIAFDYLSGEVIELDPLTSNVDFISFVSEAFFDLFSLPQERMDESYARSYQLQEELTQLDEKTLDLLENISFEDIMSESNKLDDVQSSNELNSSDMEDLPPLDANKEDETVTYHANEYVVMYDVQKEDFEVYRSEDLLSTSVDEVMSEDEKLSHLKEMGYDLNINSNLLQVEGKKSNSFVNGTVIFSATILGIVSLLGFMYIKRKEITKKI